MLDIGSLSINRTLWFSVHILSVRKRDSSKWSSLNSLFFSIIFHLFAITWYLSLRSLSLRITLPLLFMWWHSCKSLSFTFMPVKDRALHTCSSWFWSEIDPGTGMIISLLKYCAVLSAFFPILYCNFLKLVVLNEVH